MPNDGEGQILTRSELLGKLRAIESRHLPFERLLRQLGPIIAAVENGPIVEDIDGDSLKIDPHSIDMSFVRDYTHVDIYIDCPIRAHCETIVDQVNKGIREVFAGYAGASITYHLPIRK